MPWVGLVLMVVSLFQSAPGREAGRCGAQWIVLVQQSPFQSAPGREAGRCLLENGVLAADMVFQSAPGREAGRCPGGGRRASRPIMLVSIRARP